MHKLHKHFHITNEAESDADGDRHMSRNVSRITTKNHKTFAGACG